MINLQIDANLAKQNIKYINRLKRDLGVFSPEKSNYEMLLILEPLVIAGTVTRELINIKLGISLTEVQFSKIFKVQQDEIYPSEAQAIEFSKLVSNVYDLSKEEEQIVKEKFIHVWQIPRTTVVPSFDSMINLMSLFADSSIERELVIKLMAARKAA